MKCIVLLTDIKGDSKRASVHCGTSRATTSRKHCGQSFNILREHHYIQCYDNPTNNAMLVSLTVGKVDAGVAVLLTEDKRLVSVSKSAYNGSPSSELSHD